MTSHLDATPFELSEPLAGGVTVLEASAGTGKTYAIAGLAARCVAQGTPLERILLLTFTRMATGELRERVRERLLAVERALAEEPAEALGLRDPVVELLCAGPPGVVRQRRDRLARALADFDAATIATTHGFCQEVLGGLGIAGDLEPQATLVEDSGELLEEVVDDLYVRRFHHDERSERISRSEALKIARIAVANPAAEIASADGELPGMRRRLALAARRELEERKRRLSIITYDDLLMRLHDALRGPDGEATAARLRARYDVVLVDEFQDTDPVQWEIMRRAFGAGRLALVLIADPKQAIYAFRGADVHAYLEAARTAGSRRTLTINWRSDQSLLDAYDALFADARLGEEGIVYRRVSAAQANVAPRLHGAPHGAPLRIRLLPREAVTLTEKGFAANASAREQIARDLAGDLLELLCSGAQIESRSQTGQPIDSEQVGPGHTAVLVRTNRGGALVRQALADAGIPAVINGAGSVFETEIARQWLVLLEALERPASISRAHAAALTPFIGWTAEQVATAQESAWEDVHARLHAWAAVLRAEGVASLLERITAAQGLAGRMLGLADGERSLTDLRHIGQLLHAAAAAERLGTAALIAWLRRRIRDAARDSADEERSRRLESDAQAVQVLTIHRSKGLEFPVVYLPFLWEPGYIPKQGEEPVCFHDPQAGLRRVVDVALEGVDFSRHRQRYVVEQRGEDLRLAYVALTRARHQAVLWWTGSYDSRDSPLGRLVFARHRDGKVAPSGRRTPQDAEALAAFEQIAARAPAGAVSVERVELSRPARWSAPAPAPASLEAASFTRQLDVRWRRTSYSDITRAVHAGHDATVASEPEEEVVLDEPIEAREVVIEESIDRTLAQRGSYPAADGQSAAGILLAQLPGGARAGTLVHQVLQSSEFDACDLEAELGRRLAAAPARRAVQIADPSAVAAGIAAVIRTPLGLLLGDLCLRDIGRADRLDELEFELPLAGGDRPDRWVALEAISSILLEHLPAGDPLAGYAERLADPALRHSVRGYLTGSLDLVARIPGADGPRFAVLDYKTNWCSPAGSLPTVAHYRPRALVAEMYRHHYVLQALLYAVALHRYLRWRLASYDPGRHLAGVLYLFVRGMVGPRTPVLDGSRCGVFAFKPPASLVEALSDALDEGTGA